MIEQYTHVFLQVVLCIGSVFALGAFCMLMVLVARGLHMVSIRIKEENAQKIEQHNKWRRMRKFEQDECQ